MICICCDGLGPENRYNLMNRMLLRLLACLVFAAAWTCEQQPTAVQPSPPLQPPGAVQPSPPLQPPGAVQPAPPLQPPGAVQQPATEVAQQETPITFQSKVNLVLVPVVVRS